MTYLLGRELSAPKAYRAGTHRTRTPAATVAAFAPRMREFGITRLADVTGLDHVGLPVFMAVRPNARNLSVSQGKGIDRDAARASALMEAIEGWHGERISLPLRYESFPALRRSARVLDIHRLQLRPGARLRDNVPLAWVQGYELMSGDRCWVPFECVTTNGVLTPGVIPVFGLDTNGLASGNHLLEAIVHGLCEVLERDACARAKPRNKARQVDLSTVAYSSVRDVLDRLRCAELAVAVWETTSATGIPAFECQIFDRSDNPRWALKGLFAGQGCHLDQEVALLRAVTEAIQSRLTSIAGSRDDMFHYPTQANADDLEVMSRAISDPPPARSLLVTDLSTDSFEGDVEVLLEAMRSAGIEQAAVVDLSHADLGVPVVKVVVPGCRNNLS